MVHVMIVPVPVYITGSGFGFYSFYFLNIGLEFKTLDRNRNLTNVNPLNSAKLLRPGVQETAK